MKQEQISKQMQLEEIEKQVCKIASVQLAIPLEKIHINDRLIEDLNADSLDLVELLMDLEDHFDVTLPHETTEPIYKSVFVRSPFRLSNLAEMIYLQQGTGKSVRENWTRTRKALPDPMTFPFSQLNGRWKSENSELSLFEPIDSNTIWKQYRRTSDGMRCVLIPGDLVEIGEESNDALADEQPIHEVELDSFLIDMEPVSTTAYCRFLNSLPYASQENLRDWFVLAPEDDRIAQQVIHEVEGEWRPFPKTEHQPMMLVSWYGANAYSLWANGADWQQYRDNLKNKIHSFLPTEAQWEYAARGRFWQKYPWGNSEPNQKKIRFGRHQISVTYGNDDIPMANVNDVLGMSPFGLHHMAGNVWHWCADWYDKDFYQTPEASLQNAINRTPTGIRSERGGSWVGPEELCRSSHRRGREPNARGRCLGFRCISRVPDSIK